jgi:hypothetical protein
MDMCSRPSFRLVQSDTKRFIWCVCLCFGRGYLALTISSTVVTICTTCFNIKLLYIFPTECMYGFRVIFRIISLNSTNHLVFIMEMLYVFCVVRTDFVHIIWINCRLTKCSLSRSRHGFPFSCTILSYLVDDYRCFRGTCLLHLQGVFVRAKSIFRLYFYPLPPLS